MQTSTLREEILPGSGKSSYSSSVARPLGWFSSPNRAKAPCPCPAVSSSRWRPQRKITSSPAASAANDENTPETTNTASLDATIVKLLEFSDDIKDSAENTIPYSTTDYLELVDWSGRAIVEGKKGFIPEQLPPILRRLNMRPEQYLAYVRKPKYRFASALGALDKLKACAEHFEKTFLSPPYSPLCRTAEPGCGLRSKKRSGGSRGA